MKTAYRQNVDHHDMILSGGAEIDRNAYPLHMIRENAIPGFLRCRTEEMDGELLFCYDITSLQTLQSVMENQEVDAVLLRMLFLLIPDAMETLSEYLLDPQGLLLSPDMIYLNQERDQMRFCYYPGAEAGLAESLQQLGEGILPRLDHKDREAVVLGYAFYQKCCEQTEEVPVDFFRNMVRETGPEDPAEQHEEAEEEQRRQEEIVNAFFEEDDRKAKNNGRRKSGKKKGGKKFAFFQKFRRNEPEYESLGREVPEQEEQRWENSKQDEPGPQEFGRRKSGHRKRQVSDDGWRERATIADDDGYFPDDDEIKPGERKTAPGKKIESYGIKTSAYIAESKTYSAKVNSGEMEYDEEAETQILKAFSAGGGGPVPAKLVYVGSARKDTQVFLQPGQEFSLNQPMYIIGKSSRAADVVLPSPAVSRSHARIAWVSSESDHVSYGIRRDEKKHEVQPGIACRKADHGLQPGIGCQEADHNVTSGLRARADRDNDSWKGYVLRDLHSKNGTAVNGRMLNPDEEMPLHDGDEILFADLIFQYIMM